MIKAEVAAALAALSPEDRLNVLRPYLGISDATYQLLDAFNYCEAEHVRTYEDKYLIAQRAATLFELPAKQIERAWIDRKNQDLTRLCHILLRE